MASRRFVRCTTDSSIFRDALLTQAAVPTHGQICTIDDTVAPPPGTIALIEFPDWIFRADCFTALPPLPSSLTEIFHV